MAPFDEICRIRTLGIDDGLCDDMKLDMTCILSCIWLHCTALLDLTWHLGRLHEHVTCTGFDQLV